ncbi:MBL fold metallo-hydrolase [Myxococcota bacterium]|nr:MBL fold metallo-hydrolase [Myxococcota bacterium]
MSPEAQAVAEFGERDLGPVRVLFGKDGGRYPQGNSLLVRGTRETVLVDPSLGIVARGELALSVDRLVFSHCHEDHVAGAHLFPQQPWHFHEADLPGIRSVDAMMAIYGFSGEVEQDFRRVLTDEFHFTPCPDPKPYRDGDVFDLGGVRLRVLHTPGHTRGHCCFLIDWDGSEDRVLYLGDIDLSSFGPYYGDAWSDLLDFERTLERVRKIEARWYVTFHHIGVLETREAFLERFDRFEAVIARREAALLEFLAEPRSLAEVAEHRFVYRPGDAVSFADPVEQRSMGQHIERLVAAGRVRRVDDLRWVAC